MPQLHHGKPSVNVCDINKKQNHSNGKPKNENIKSIDSITITVTIFVRKG